MNILVCVKRVPDVGAKIELTEDRQKIETRNLGFTISPHEECAVEQAIQLVEKQGGTVTVLTLSVPAAEEQLRECLAKGADRGVLLVSDGEEWDPHQIAEAIAAYVRVEEKKANRFDLLLFGSESADSGYAQVGIRVACALDLPCVTSVKGLEMNGQIAVAKRETAEGWEVAEVSLPAVLTAKDGLNLPRRASLRGTMMAKKKMVEHIKPERAAAGLAFIRFASPAQVKKQAAMLGTGPEAAPRVIEILRKLELLP